MALPNFHRRCIGCWSGKNKREMLRIAKFKDSKPEIDLKQTKPGRGVYFCLNLECIKSAKKKRALEKFFRCSIEEEFYDRIMEQVKTIEKGED